MSEKLSRNELFEPYTREDILLAIETARVRTPTAWELMTAEFVDDTVDSNS